MTDVVRLYRFFKPERYELKLKPDKNTMEFSGSVVIIGVLAHNQKLLRLHSKDLTIESVLINSQSAKFKLVKNDDELQIRLPKAVIDLNIKIAIKFSGKITKPMHGIYPCFTENNEVIIATQLESHHAREVFPCIDEPEAKAVFCLTLNTPNNKDVILANTMLLSQAVFNNYKTTTFEDTPLMSPYLLAFVIGDLQVKEAKTKDNILVRAWASPEHSQHTSFCLDVAVKTLEFFNDYFNIPYPLQKCDFVALPDFGAAAMENWGLITFRESCMLVDPKNTSVDTKQFVAVVVVHEIAHQWFGNLVTMRWWNDLWLNEGFVSWIEYLAVDSIFPEWHMWTQFLVSEQLLALRLDSLKNTHAIEVKVPHPDEIRTIFDSISYAKGACVIHMLHEYLGGIDFRNGVIDYLKKYAYSNAQTDDLWDSLEASSGKQVRQFMSAWTKQPGFPLVEVSLTDGRLRITQKRFSESKNKLNKELWPVPLLASELDETILDSQRIFVVKPKNLKKFKLNQGQSGFYITKYWPKQYDQLGSLIKSGHLAENDRLSLLSDMLALTKTARLPLKRLVKLLPCYSNEVSAPVWDSIAMVLGDIRRVMGPEVREAIKPLVLNLTYSQLQRLGWEEKPKELYFDKLLRPMILAFADSADNQQVIEEAKQRFDKASTIRELPSDLRSMIMLSIARRGKKAEFDKMLGMLKETASPEDKIILANSLTYFKQPSEYLRALSLIKSKHVRLQDVVYWVTASLANPEARDSTWFWIQNNWSWLKANLGEDIVYSRLPVYVARSYSDKTVLKDYREFFNSVSEPSLIRSIKQGIETINLQANWRKRDEQSLLKWLKNI